MIPAVFFHFFLDCHPDRLIIKEYLRIIQICEGGAEVYYARDMFKSLRFNKEKKNEDGEAVITIDVRWGLYIRC